MPTGIVSDIGPCVWAGRPGVVQVLGDTSEVVYVCGCGTGRLTGLRVQIEIPLNAMLTAIIVAAGSSRRMGFDKLFADLHGKPVLWHSIAAFAKCEEVADLVLVTRAENLKQVESLVADAAPGKQCRVVVGGAERHLSVWGGLQTLDLAVSKFVAVHDGARPLITPDSIRACLALAERDGAACCASPIPDTVKRVDLDSVVTESVDRVGLWAMQTPQIFESSLILQAYAAIITRSDMVTDEVSAVQKLGRRVALYNNEEWNFKITFRRDMEMAEHVLKLRDEAALKGTEQ